MATFSVDGSSGLINLVGTDAGEQELASLSERYIEATYGIDWTYSEAGTLTIQAKYRAGGGGAYYGVDYVIDTTLDELTSITLTDTGTPLATVVVNIPHTPGTPINTRITSTTRQQVRVWLSTDPEPSTWDIDEVEDSLPPGTFALGALSNFGGTPVAATPTTLEIINAQNGNIVIPADAVVGALLLLFISNYGLITTPTDWDIHRQDVGVGANNLTQTLFTKVCEPGEPGTNVAINTTLGGGNSFAACSMLSYSNTSIHVDDADVSVTDGITITAPSVTTTVNGAIVLECFGAGQAVNQSDPVNTVPATQQTNVQGFSGLNNFARHATSMQTQTNAGPTGALNANVNNNSSWVGTTVALVEGNAVTSFDNLEILSCVSG